MRRKTGRINIGKDERTLSIKTVFADRLRAVEAKRVPLLVWNLCCRTIVNRSCRRGRRKEKYETRPSLNEDESVKIRSLRQFKDSIRRMSRNRFAKADKKKVMKKYPLQQLLRIWLGVHSDQWFYWFYNWTLDSPLSNSNASLFINHNKELTKVIGFVWNCK